MKVTQLIDPSDATFTSPEDAASRLSASERLSDAYQDYCHLQLERSTAEASMAAIRRLASLWRTEFPADLVEYWELNDRMYEIWRRTVGRTDPQNHRVFQTTGSTKNGSRFYPVGPHADDWIRAIWALTRHPFGPRTMVALIPVIHPGAELMLTESDSIVYQYIIQCGPLGPRVVGQLTATLHSLLDRHGELSLTCLPDSLLYLNRQPEFEEFVVTHRDRLNLMSEHWEPFYARHHLERQGVHLNDPMCDWTTGLAFFTCRAGFQHTLPTFATSGSDRVNLVNMMLTPTLGPGTEEDDFRPESIVRCSCGRHRLNYHFVPHQATALRPPRGGVLYDPGLAERLESSFRCLQFIQEGETLLIRYQVEGELQDQELLEDYFRPHGYRLEWQPNDVYMVGTKRPVFYRYPG